MTKSMQERERILSEWDTLRHHDLEVEVVDEETLKLIWVKKYQVNNGGNMIQSANTREKTIKVGEPIPIFQVDG